MVRRIGPFWMLGLVLLWSKTGVSAQEEPPGPNRPVKVDPRVEERARYASEAAELRSEWELDAAIAAAEKMLAIDCERLAEFSERGQTEEARRVALDLVASLQLLAELHETRESEKDDPDYATARQARREALERLEELYPLGHPQRYRVTDASLALEHVARLEQLSKAERAALYQALSLDRAVVQLYRARRFGHALPFARRAVETHRRILGEEHPFYTTSLYNLASLYAAMGDYDRAGPLVRTVLETVKKTLGEEHPRYITALYSLAGVYEAKGDYAQAEPLYRKALAMSKKVLGELHPGYTFGLRHLGQLYRTMGDYARAEPLLREALKTCKVTHGKGHPNYAAHLNELATLYWHMGDYARAEPLYRQASEIYRGVFGEEHPSYATSLSNLATLYEATGDYARAEPLFRRALDIRKRVLGEEHPSYATSLYLLAELYENTRDYVRAEALYRRALEIRKKVLGDEHPSVADTLEALGRVATRTGTYRTAETFYQKTLQIRLKTLGDRHPSVATSLNNLAMLYGFLGQHARAVLYQRQAVELYSQHLGKDRLGYAISLCNLGALYEAMGDYDRAEPLYREGLEIAKKSVGESHLQYAGLLHNFGHLLQTMDRSLEAEDTMRRSLEICLGFRDRVFAMQNERQRLSWTATTRHHLDHWLAVAGQANVATETMHWAVLRWKGAVLARSLEDRAALRRPELASLVRRLTMVRSRWATLALQVPAPHRRKAWQRQVKELFEEKERLESELARQSAAYRHARSLAGLSPAELAARLPERTVFVDFFVYVDYSPPKQKGARGEREQRLLAFVLRAGRKPAILQLGPVGPIARAVDTWRESFGRDAASRRAGEELDRLIGAPLRSHLKDADTVLVAPDGPLCRFPLAVLPGHRQDRYLLEDLAIGYVGSGQQLAELLVEGPEEQEPPVSGQGLLLAGGIEYGAAAPPGAGTEKKHALLAARGARRAIGLDERLRVSFSFLPGTLLEAEQIVKLFAEQFPDARWQLLSGAEATEERLKRELTGGHWRYVHLATHGFFAPPDKLPAWRAATSLGGLPHWATEDTRITTGLYDPLLLSGLAVAGASRKPNTSEAASSGPGEEDGILTAAEVADLDLHGTELVVLSACETGLGAVAGGEGVLGLQRAFHAAGAETLVTSLWRVNDAATSVLMEDFYRNLWHRRLPRLEALRQAQLFLLEHPERVQQRARELRRRAEELRAKLGQRGLRLEPVKLPDTPISTRRTDPALWAGFLLSGQWQ